MNAFAKLIRLPAVKGLFFLVIIFLGGCQKELSFEKPPAGGTAVFALVSSGSNCSDAVVSGVFQAGTALSAGAQITATVKVTTTGSWNFSTGTINGFAFVGTGSFAANGSQVINLQAVGTPAAAGTNTFPLNIGGASCSISVTVSAGSGGGGAGGTTSDIYYKATIGGTSYTQYVTDNNGYEAGSGMGGVDDVAFGAGINYANPPAPAGSTEMGIDKGLMHQYVSASNAQFKAFFAPGDYSYAPSSFSLGDGVRVSWTDPAGEHWDTRDGTVDQAGSTFKIISITDAPDALGRYYIKVKMQFSCKLYNVATGAMKQLTNGEMVGYFGKL